MSFIDEVKALEQFEALARARRSVVIYSEGPEYWPHIRGLLRELILKQHCPCVYVSSSEADPGLALRHPLVQTFNIGKGGSRVNLFKDLDAGILVLTMPDLGALTLKRSAACKSYVYVFHSPVSTHMIYRADAFDHYDVVFCAGPHHEAEIRRRESALKLPAKRLFQHGYGRLDEIIEAMPSGAHSAPAAGRPIEVLVAPSWGASGVFETIGEDVVGALLAAGFRVIARPHPQTVKLAGDRVADLKNRFASHANFVLELDMADKRSFLASDVLISDWSGAAFDFAFARLKPVVFIDVPRKVNNPGYADLGIEPVEASIRARIGHVVAPGDTSGLVAAVSAAVNDVEGRRRIVEERDRSIFNIRQSAAIGAAELARMAFDQSLGDAGTVDDLAQRCWAFARRRCVAHGAATADGSLAALLSRVIVAGPAAWVMSGAALDQLTAVCRRIDVFRKLHTQYDRQFARPTADALDAPVHDYALLSLVLLHSARCPDVQDRGLALKFLNAAGNALDQYVARGGVAGAVAIESLLGRAHAAMTGDAPCKRFR